MRKKIRISDTVLMRLARLSGSAFRVYAALVQLAGQKAPRCEATYRQVADAAGLARSTAVAAVQELARAGLVTVERHPDAAAGHRPNIYTVLLEA